MHPRATRCQEGFTLLELIIALTICALIGVGAHVMFQSVLRAHGAGKQHSQALTRLQKAMWMMADDMRQCLPHSIRPSSEGYTITLVRQGVSAPSGASRSELLYVAYELDNRTLKRHYWPADHTDTAAQTQILLDDVQRFTVQEVTPLALEFTLDTRQYGTLRRIMEIPVDERSQ